MTHYTSTLVARYPEESGRPILAISVRRSPRLENFALRQQLGVLQRGHPQPRLRTHEETSRGVEDYAPPGRGREVGDFEEV